MTATLDEITVADPEFGPDERYRIYERTRGGTYESSWGPLPLPESMRGFTLVATCATPAAVGVALVTLAEDRWEAEDRSAPVIGVLDGERRRWVTGMWIGGG